MTYKEHFRKNFVLAYPVMLSQMGHIFVSLADSIMVGRLGAVPLASVSLAISIFSVILLFGIGITYGITPLIASADGQDDQAKSASLLKHGLVLNTAVGVILLIITLIGAELLPYFGQDPDVLAGSLPYLRIMAYSMLPLMLFQTFRQFAEGLSFTKESMYISVTGNLVNIGLNYILIFGKFGLPAMGLVGAGWATLIARVLMAILMGGFVMTYRGFKPYKRLLGSVILSKGSFREILRIGVPSGLQYIFEVGAFSAAAIMVGWTGAISLAAHQIALNLSAITYMTATGIAAAATIRVGNQLGRKDIFTLRRAGLTCFVMAAIFMSGCALFFTLCNEFLPTLYINDAQVIQYASVLLIIAAFFQISDGVQAVGLGALRGLADVKIPTYVTLFAYWGMAIPIGYFLGIVLEMGARGIWIGLLTGLTIAAILHLYRFRSLTSKLLIAHNQ